MRIGMTLDSMLIDPDVKKFLMDVFTGKEKMEAKDFVFQCGDLTRTERVSFTSLHLENGICTDVIISDITEDIRKEGGQSLDPNEEIVVIEVPVEEVIRDMGEGLYDNGIMMEAIGFFMRYAEKHPQLRTLTV